MDIGLSSGSSGPDVARLHRVLEAAGPVIEVGEKDRQEFGASTFEALLAFQRERGLAAPGEIDAPTYAALVAVEENITVNVSETSPAPRQEEHRGTAQIRLVDEDGEAGRGHPSIAFRAGREGRQAARRRRHRTAGPVHDHLPPPEAAEPPGSRLRRDAEGHCPVRHRTLLRPRRFRSTSPPPPTG